MNRSETKANTLQRIQEELARLNTETDTNNEIQLDENTRFRLNNIGYSLKRIADSLETIAHILIKDRQDRM